MDKKDFLRVADYTKRDMLDVLDLASRIKARQKKGDPFQPLTGKTLGLIFQKSSTRTRVSFEVGMYQLGGYPLFLSANDLQLKRGETIGDTAQTLSRMLDAIMLRTFAHSEIEELARYATVPVINGLTDDHHPCQIMADLLTVLEHKKKLKGLTVTWVGDGNNVLNSWIEAAPMLGINLRMAVPKGYAPDKEILKYGVDLARKEGTEMLLTNDPVEGVKKSDVIYTDVWVSMGQDAEKEKKLRDFRDFQINETLVKHANRDYLFMHCLPAHRGEEVSAGVIDGPNSIVFDEAENRLHAQKAILVMHLLRGKKINV